jgi:hypothetical protein
MASSGALGYGGATHMHGGFTGGPSPPVDRDRLVSWGHNVSVGPGHGPSQMLPYGGYPSFHNPWEPFFGMAPKPYYPLPYERENADLPDAYVGQNYHLSQVVISNVTAAEAYLVNEVLPWKKAEDTDELKWDVLTFNDHMLNRRPEESTSRLLSFQRSEEGASFVSYGIAMILESGFYKTPRGREFYAFHLKQISNATVETACLGAALELLNSKPPASSYAERNDLGLSHAEFRRLVQREVDLFGVVQKTENGLEVAHDLLREVLSQRGVQPNYTIVPQGVMKYLRTARLENNNFLYSGSTAQKGPNTSGMGTVRESRSFRIGEKRPNYDPTFQTRTIGNYFHMLAESTRNIPAEHYQSCFRDIYAWSENANDWYKHDLRTVLNKCGLFVPGTHELTSLGERYMAEVGVDNYWDYLAAGHMTDQVREAIVKKDDKFNSFKRNFILDPDSVGVPPEKQLKNFVGNRVLAHGRAANTGYLQNLVRDMNKRRKQTWAFDPDIAFATASKALDDVADDKARGCVPLSFFDTTGNIVTVACDKDTSEEESNMARVVFYLSRMLFQFKDGDVSGHNPTTEANARDKYEANVDKLFELLDTYFNILMPQQQPVAIFLLSLQCKDLLSKLAAANAAGNTSWPDIAKYFIDNDFIDNNMSNVWKSCMNASVYVREAIAARAEKVSATEYKLSEVAASELATAVTYSANASCDFKLAYTAKTLHLKGTSLSTDARFRPIPNGHMEVEVDNDWDQADEKELEEVYLAVNKERAFITRMGVKFPSLVSMNKRILPLIVKSHKADQDLCQHLYRIWVTSACVYSVIESKEQDVDRQQEAAKIVSVLLGEPVVEAALIFVERVQSDAVLAAVFATPNATLSSIADQLNTTPAYMKSMYAYAEQAHTTAWHAQETMLHDSNIHFQDHGEARLEHKYNAPVGFSARYRGGGGGGGLTPEDKDWMVKHTLSFMPLHFGRFFFWCVDNNVPLALSFLLLAPHMRFRCGSMVLCKAGGELGNTYYGWPDFQLGRNANQKMIFGHFTVKLRALVRNKNLITVGRDVYVNGYEGGGGHKYWSYDGQDRQRYLNNEMEERDLFVVAVPPTYRPSDDMFDICGRFDPTVYSSEDSVEKHYPSAGVYAPYWGWRHGIDPLKQNYECRDMPRYNTLVLQGAQCNFRHNGSGHGEWKDYVLNKGHLGDRIYSGCASVRNGAHMHALPINYSQTAALAVIT